LNLNKKEDKKMKRLILIGVVFFVIYGYAKNAYSEEPEEEPEIADSLGYPLSDYNPGSYNDRVFGCCWPRHLGEDDERLPLTPVRSIGNGRVITGIVSRAHTCYGMVVVIEHTLLKENTLFDENKITSIYGHLSNREGYKPKLSGIVKKGDIIGYVGHSGGTPPYGKPKKCGRHLDDENGDGGPHLHFGIRKGPAPKDKYGNYTWVYYGYGPTNGEDVDYDSQNRYFGGKFMSGKVFIDKYNATYSNRDQDNDGYTTSQGDCDDQNKEIHPGAKELCDGIDNNCDGNKDEDFPELNTSCTSYVYECPQEGKWVCNLEFGGTKCQSIGDPIEPSPELCDYLDNDCDGEIDEDWKTGLAIDLGKPCENTRGECKAQGTVVCTPDGLGVICDAEIEIGEEICDYLDNDCDGDIDEGFNIGEPCAVGVGACQDTGVIVCIESDPYNSYCSVAPLEPDCTGKECGDDGCGGSCGECGEGQFCNPQFQCQPIGADCPTDKDCTNLECGPDPVCGESCGTCIAPEVCGGDGESGICGIPLGNHLWSKRFGAAGGDDPGRSVAVDSNNNVFVTGAFSGTVNFGGSDLTGAGGFDIFLAKYDTNGNHLWSKRFGAGDWDEGFSVAVDSNGNVFVTGRFKETINFGGGELTSAGGSDIFLAKYDANGNYLWSKRFGAGSSDGGFSATVDTSGNVLVTGSFQDAVDFGGGELTSAGLEDIFLARYDANGTHLWSKRFGAGGDEVGFSVAADSSDNVFVTGRFKETINFGGSNLVSVGDYDIFLAKYDVNGNHLWSKRFGAGSWDFGRSVAVDSNDNVFVTGFFADTVDFGGGGFTSAGSLDIFLTKYDANGNHLWSKRFGDADLDDGYSVAVDSSGNVFVTGEFQGIVNFGGNNLASAGGRDIFLTKYDANGAHLWSKRFGDTDQDEGFSIAAGSSGNVFVTGVFSGTVNFGDGPLTSAGYNDIFLLKLAP